MDLEVRIPTDRPGGRGGMAVRSYGEVTLVVDLRDSQSGEILARAGDRRDPTRNTDMSLARVETVFVKADTERLFNYWADLMRERLDELRGLEVS
jgi:hypothetical protein